LRLIFDTGEDIDFDKRITGGQWADLLLDERDVMQSVNGPYRLVLAECTENQLQKV